jgi:hyaluronate lyase
MIKFQYNWIINSYLPLIYNGGYTDIVRGRSVSRNIRGDQSGKYIMNTLCLMTDYLTEKNDIYYLKQILKEFYQLNKPYFMYVLTPASLIKLEEIENDNNIQPKKINNFAKVFSRGDIAISQVNNVGIGISMSSSRIGKYESINGENMKGWYSGDGMVYIYLNVNDYASNYWQNVNFYRLQGTTVTNAKRVEKGFSGENSLAKYDFVGGVYSNLNMVAAMTFGSESPKIGFYSTLVGNKSYFVFEGKLICLGNNINSEDDYGVETIIENRNLTGKFYFGDKEINDKIGNVNSNYIYIENYGGIYIPEYNKVKYDITSNNFLEIYIEHGIKIKNEKYAYMIFPKIDKNELKENVDNIEILSNNNIVSAVKNKKLNIIGYIFWQSGKFNNISVDSPCILLIEDGYIYASDPTQKLEYLNVSFGNDYYQLRVEKGYTSKIKIK